MRRNIRAACTSADPGGGDFLIKNLKMNKMAVIMREIGRQPVLSFGNSTGDSSMAEFVTGGKRYRSLAFMLCCDDVERENGSPAKADKMGKQPPAAADPCKAGEMNDTEEAKC